MKWLKLCALVALTLAVMRASSWTVGWALTRLAAVKTNTAVIAANCLAFALFLLLLYWSLLPGEPMDMAAVAFALLVFAAFAVTDLFWRPWKQKH